jgi:hypothetical protein
MKIIGALVPGLLLTALCWPQSASAQNVPPGTYLRSCGEAHVRGDTLVATCRRADGNAERTSLPAVRSCVGDIGNMNGRLTCNHAGAHSAPQPYYGAPRGGPPDDRGYAPPSYGGYGPPGYGR